jgi:hypothetical protein
MEKEEIIAIFTGAAAQFVVVGRGAIQSTSLYTLR